ncbi:Clavaminate synthase-like protein [Mycena floridula]|nr:Clavaminate synthase-like protein [Mycena floridula]
MTTARETLTIPHILNPGPTEQHLYRSDYPQANGRTLYNNPWPQLHQHDPRANIQDALFHQQSHQTATAGYPLHQPQSQHNYSSNQRPQWPEQSGSYGEYDSGVARTYVESDMPLIQPIIPHHEYQRYQSAERTSTRLAVQASMAPVQLQIPNGHQSISSQHRFSQPPQESTSRKRPLDSSDPSVPQAKKSKRPRAESSPAVAKKGYSTKKRNEIAQFAAESAQMAQTLVTVPTTGTSKGKDRAPNGHRVTLNTLSVSHILRLEPLPIIVADKQGNSSKLQPELQSARCMSSKYKYDNFPRCVACTRRWAGDTCRFQGVRFFLKDEDRQIVGISFMEFQKDEPTLEFPTKWNVKLTKDHVLSTKRTAAKGLISILRKELQHIQSKQIIHRSRETEVRVTCDTCITSLFCGTWMCRQCGREACADCFEQIQQLTINDPNATPEEKAQLQDRRDRHAHSHPFFLSCNKRTEHCAKDFSPVSRFCRAQLQDAVAKMDETLKEMEGEQRLAGSSQPKLLSSVVSPDAGESIELEPSLSSHIAVLGPDLPPSPYYPTSLLQLYKSPIPQTSSPVSIPSHQITSLYHEELTDDEFQRLWTKGEPLLITGLSNKFKIQWTPEYFMDHYGDQGCLVVECNRDKNDRVTVLDFFKQFGKYEGRTECWKLKDWPPSTDFKSAFPELYEDFSQAVPVPSYVRRDGTMNISSHFPSNTISPDLGPKMYNAMASNEDPGSKGSTRLHMDMSDAVNVMTYASPAPDGSPGSAAWDLFRAEDSDKIRTYLKQKFRGQYQHDPIHSQQFYLDETMRRELWQQHGVISYRVYQTPGQAVFIPAGCAHQVCNLADIVKVAIDFVSPENIVRCEKLTKEFREQNQAQVWKEDVLQLTTMLWFAWLSCTRENIETLLEL